jgi:hypothetical protein
MSGKAVSKQVVVDTLPIQAGTFGGALAGHP